MPNASFILMIVSLSLALGAALALLPHRAPCPQTARKRQRREVPALWLE